jgi:hypothetical protein
MTFFGRVPGARPREAAVGVVGVGGEHWLRTRSLRPVFVEAGVDAGVDGAEDGVDDGASVLLEPGDDVGS